MKALTLHQPWAQLVAVGAKTVETRSWTTRYRGSLAIHAGKSKGATECSECWDRLREDWDMSVDLPLGAVIAVCQLVAVLPTDELDPSDRFHTSEYPDMSDGELLTEGLTGATLLPRNQRWKLEENWPLGDFSPGRFAWLLGNIQPLPRPIEARGFQGLWTW